MKWIDRKNNIIQVHVRDADTLMNILHYQSELDTTELEMALKTEKTIVLVINKDI